MRRTKAGHDHAVRESLYSAFTPLSEASRPAISAKLFTITPLVLTLAHPMLLLHMGGAMVFWPSPFRFVFPDRLLQYELLETLRLDGRSSSLVP